MGYALKIYEAFQDLGKDKAAILAEFVEYMESKKAATTEELKETELRLQKEIEVAKLELTKHIEKVKEEFKKEVEKVKLEIEKIRAEFSERVEKIRAELVKWMFAFWTGQLIALIGILKWFYINKFEIITEVEDVKDKDWRKFFSYSS